MCLLRFFLYLLLIDGLARVHAHAIYTLRIRRLQSLGHDTQIFQLAHVISLYVRINTIITCLKTHQLLAQKLTHLATGCGVEEIVDSTANIATVVVAIDNAIYIAHRHAIAEQNKL